MTHPKQIGNDFERLFSKLLSKWLTGSEEKLVVWRNTHSGSLGTKRVNEGLSGANVDGDIQCLDATYKPFFDLFYIDTKSYSDINWCFINEANQKSNKLLQEWFKVCEDASKQSKIPMMPVKVRDGKTPLLLFLPLQNIYFGDRIIISTDKFSYFQVFLLNDFFTKNTWQQLIDLNLTT